MGWLYALTLALGMSLGLWLVWLYFHSRAYDQSGQLFWFALAPMLWLALFGMGLLALILLLDKLFRRQWRQALAWAGLCILATGFCVLTFFPLALLTISAPSVGDPPHVNDEQ